MKRTQLAAIILVLILTTAIVYTLSATQTVEPMLYRSTHETIFAKYENDTNYAPEGTVLAKRVSSVGWSLELYLPTTAKEGDLVILYTAILMENSSAEDTIRSGLITVTDSNGSIAYQTPIVRIGDEKMEVGKL